MSNELKPVAYVNGDELANMLDDRTATIETNRSGWRATPLYATPPAAVADERDAAWISVEDRLPAPFVNCLVTWSCAGESRIAIAGLWVKWKGHHLWHGHPGAHVDVTHWQPLPSLPAAIKASEGTTTAAPGGAKQ